jgi:hypothetical protein
MTDKPYDPTDPSPPKRKKKRKAKRIMPPSMDTTKRQQVQDVVQSVPKKLEDAFALCLRYSKHMYFSHMMEQAFAYMLTPLWLADAFRTLWLHGKPETKRDLEAAWDAVRATVLARVGLKAGDIDATPPAPAPSGASEPEHETDTHESEAPKQEGEKNDHPTDRES